MLFPACVHKDEGSSYGLTFPDLEGCFAAADTLKELQKAAQDVVQVHSNGESFALPSASAPEQWVGGERFAGGCWMAVDIDLAKIRLLAI